MPIDKERAGYFASSLTKLLLRRGLACPSCGGGRGEVVSRKYGVTSLRRCRDCCLLFRAPTGAEGDPRDYYERRYESGFTTALPSPEALKVYLQKVFSGTPKDFRRYIAIARALGARKGNRLLDLGCSWGYGLWQFRKAGYVPFGLEIATERAAFARERLGVPAVSDPDEVEGTFDVIFSAHVLEHIARLQPVLAFAFERLRPGGLFVAITPNGSSEFRARSPAQWHRLWGLKHPLFLDARYWLKAIDHSPLFLSTALDDRRAMGQWSRLPVNTVGPLSGWELVAAFKKAAPSTAALKFRYP